MNCPEMAASVLTDAHAKIDTLTGNLLAALEEGDKLTCARVNPKSASCWSSHPALHVLNVTDHAPRINP